MATFSSERSRQFYAETYDTVVHDWHGEIHFYRQLVAEADARNPAVLEVACGTGRVAIRLAQEGVQMVGLDVSSAMLSVARKKTRGMSNIHLVQDSMRSSDWSSSRAALFRTC